MDKNEKDLRGWWCADINVKLIGKEDVCFNDLSEVTKNHILKSIFKGYTLGGIWRVKKTNEE